MLLVARSKMKRDKTPKNELANYLIGRKNTVQIET